MSDGIIGIFIDVGIPLLTGIFGFLLGKLKHTQMVLTNWSKLRANEVAEQREDMHTVLLGAIGTNGGPLEATIDYRFRKLFESINYSPLNKQVTSQYQTHLMKLYSINSFDRRSLTEESMAALSAEINECCVALETLLETAINKTSIFTKISQGM